MKHAKLRKQIAHSNVHYPDMGGVRSGEHSDTATNGGSKVHCDVVRMRMKVRW